MTNFNKWLNTFIDEKGIDTDTYFDVEGASGVNMMSYETVLDAIKQAPASEQAAIKTMIVKIDFVNGDVCHYLRHLAQAIAI